MPSEVGYFECLWRFTEDLRNNLSSNRLSDRDLSDALKGLKEAVNLASGFDHDWQGPEDEHPGIVPFIKSQNRLIEESISASNPRKRARVLSRVHMNLSDFLYAHGKRFGYIHKSLASEKEMWAAANGLVSFSPSRE